MISCRESVAMLRAHLAGDLEAPERGLVATHEEECADCRAFAATYSLAISLAPGAVPEEVPAGVIGLLAEVAAAMRQAAVQPPPEAGNGDSGAGASNTGSDPGKPRADEGSRATGRGRKGAHPENGDSGH